MFAKREIDVVATIRSWPLQRDCCRLRLWSGRGFWLPNLVASFLVGFLGSPAFAGDPLPDLFAVQFRAFSTPPLFQQALNVDDSGAVVTTTPVFGPPGGIFAADFFDGTFYVAALENGGSRYFLGTVPHDGALIGQGALVGATPIGFENVEALAATEDRLLGASVSFAAHRTTLIEIDPVTGVGQAIGLMSRNVIIVGMAYDRSTGILYGVGVPFGAGEQDAVNTPNLYEIDPQTGAEILVGPLGTTLHSLAWDDELGLVGAFETMFSVDPDTGAAALLGCADFTVGAAGNGIYALGALTAPGLGSARSVLPSGAQLSVPRADLCPAVVCGNGVLEHGEGCDDGDTSFTAGEFCTASCARVPCGQPVSIAAAKPVAGDALFALKAAVGVESCDLRVCDVDASARVLANDPLAILKKAVGLPEMLTCSKSP